MEIDVVIPILNIDRIVRFKNIKTLLKSLYKFKSLKPTIKAIAKSKNFFKWEETVQIELINKMVNLVDNQSKITYLKFDGVLLYKGDKVRLKKGHKVFYVDGTTNEIKIDNTNAGVYSVYYTETFYEGKFHLHRVYLKSKTNNFYIYQLNNSFHVIKV